ncbi:SRPBCC domain-containing protein [Arthrobacter sp. A5]|uniref:SRPBCC domain-containing protein n=1 Tax=Arthrobacter sp. A5 TaxID=576926 RepID=UPI003DA7DB9D
MEYGRIEREIHVDASPDGVFEVLSSPEHLKEWWRDEAEIDAAAGATGRIVFHRAAPEEALVVTIMVVDAQPPRRFSFRWVYEARAVPGPSNSLLVTFDLEPSGEGTRVRMTEIGFRERAGRLLFWSRSTRSTARVGTTSSPRLGEYVARLVSSS